MPLAFHHLALQCHDLARCERFYVEVLGLPVLRRWPREGGGDRSVWLGLGDGFLALERAVDPPAPSEFRHGGAGLHLVALRIAPSERLAWEARLAAAGAPVVHRTRYTLYVRDPEGNRVGLSHHPEEAPVTFLRRRYGQDNWAYLLAEEGDAALVDPGDAEAGLALAAEAEAAGARVRAILHTHGHHDHSGGSDALRRRLSVPVMGHAADSAWFAPDRDLAGERQLRLGALEVEVIPAPGHTPGSLLFRWGGRLLTGDTLFHGGSGNCRHGGDPRRLAHTFLDTLGALDGALEVHPGHDYGARNLPFVLDLEPGNAEARLALEEVRGAHERREDPPPATLARERAVNPFLRAGDLAVSAAAARGGAAPAPGEETFLALRRLRDSW